MKKLLSILVILTVLLSCSKEKQEGEVLIRIKNETSVVVEDAKIYSGRTLNDETSIERTYGNIPAGQSSGYQRHQIIMSYGPYFSLSMTGYGELKTEAGRICPVGASQLSPGNYTFVISNDGNGGLYTSLRPD